MVPELRQLFRNRLRDQFAAYIAPIAQPGAVPQPLPHLRARDLRRCGVFHQVVNRHGAIAAQPRFQVLDADVHVQPQPLLADFVWRNPQKIARPDLDVFALDPNLVRLRHVRVENLLGHGHQAGMRHPCPIMPCLDFTQLILPDSLNRLLVGLGIVLNGNLRGHAPHGVNAAPVAGLDQQVYVRFEEVAIHRDQRPIGQQKIRAVAKLLDETENVVPAAAVQPRRVIAQLV